MIDGTRLRPQQLIALAKNSDLSEFLDERIGDLTDELIRLDPVEAQAEIIECVRRIQILHRILSEIADFGEAAATALEGKTHGR